MSTPPLTPRTNPYATLLTASLEQRAGVRPEFFSWRRGLVGHFDVFHLHWPESHLRGSTWLKTVGRQALFSLIILRAFVLGRPIVRTVHNVELPRDISSRERAILQWIERRTALLIRLNDATPVPPEAPVETIKHGHYREWFAGYAKHDSIVGRIAFFGLIRRYKAVSELTRAFAETDEHPELSLHVSGQPSSTELATELRAAAAADPRVFLCLRRIDDAELVREVGEAELVVLPYPEMHNSGAVLTALSLNRPVLVPDNQVNRGLAEEVGRGWVFCYDPPLTGQHILNTLAERRELAPSMIPDLDMRDWHRNAAEHEHAYRRAIALRGRRRPTRPPR